METKTCRPYLYGEHILTVPSLGSDLTDADFCWVIRDVDLVRIVEFLHSSCLICVTAIWQLRFWRTWNKCYVLTVDVTVLSDLLYSIYREDNCGISASTVTQKLIQSHNDLKSFSTCLVGFWCRILPPTLTYPAPEHVPPLHPQGFMKNSSFKDKKDNVQGHLG